MRAPAIVRRHPEVFWLATAGVVVVLVIAAISSISGVFRDDEALPATSPEQLVNEVRATHVGGYAGNIATDLQLGLPHALTRAVSRAVPLGGSLLHGSHALHYWYGDADHQRVAVVGQETELDVFRNGSQVLLWDSFTRTGMRTTTDAVDHSPLPLALANPAALTPPQLADRLLAMAGTSGDITLRSGPRVAGEDTYELVVLPENGLSRIGEVHIQIDGREAVPLRVQVFPRGATRPAIDVYFTAITFGEPPSGNFSFVAPAAAPTPLDGAPTASDAFATDASDVGTVGSGWLAAASYRSPSVRVAPIIARRVLGRDLVRVKGRWGSGRLLETPLLCVLLTSTGRLVAGPVAPTVLYQAVGG